MLWIEFDLFENLDKLAETCATSKTSRLPKSLKKFNSPVIHLKKVYQDSRLKLVSSIWNPTFVEKFVEIFWTCLKSVKIRRKSNSLNLDQRNVQIDTKVFEKQSIGQRSWKLRKSWSSLRKRKLISRSRPGFSSSEFCVQASCLRENSLIKSFQKRFPARIFCVNQIYLVLLGHRRHPISSWSPHWI